MIAILSDGRFFAVAMVSAIHYNSDEEDDADFDNFDDEEE